MKQCIVTILMLATASVVMAQQDFPFSPGIGEIRVVTWNIENLGNRSPRRSDADLALLAERIAGFEAPVLALQEISSAARATLDTVLAHLGPDWRVAGGATNGFIYDSRVVELLLSEELQQLRQPPYNSFYQDFPNWQNAFGSNGDPFTNGRSLPFFARFRLIGPGSALPFSLVSAHFHAGGEFDTQRRYEGLAIQAWLDEQEQAGGIDLAYLLGDFNARPGASPHTELSLQRLEKENTTNTVILSAGGVELDHIYATDTGFSVVSRATAYVIRPEHYGESAQQFEAIYSDHAPVLMDLNLIASLGYSGSWYDPEHTGEGFMVQVLDGSRILINWYTYDAASEQMWLTGVGTLTGNTAVIEEMYVTSGGVFGPEFDPEAVQLTVWGSLVFTFLNCSLAQADYESLLGFGSGTLNPIRLTFIAGLDCPTDAE